MVSLGGRANICAMRDVSKARPVLVFCPATRVAQALHARAARAALRRVRHRGFAAEHPAGERAAARGDGRGPRAHACHEPATRHEPPKAALVKKEPGGGFKKEPGGRFKKEPGGGFPSLGSTSSHFCSSWQAPVADTHDLVFACFVLRLACVSTGNSTWPISPPPSRP